MVITSELNIMSGERTLYLLRFHARNNYLLVDCLHTFHRIDSYEPSSLAPIQGLLNINVLSVSESFFQAFILLFLVRLVYLGCILFREVWASAYDQDV